jgi:CheY-like chemotaxis protein
MRETHLQPLVLVLGGEGEARQLAAAALHEHGYDVLEAACTEDGLSRLTPFSNLCAAVVCDLGGADPASLRDRLRRGRPEIGIVYLVDAKENGVHHNGGWTEIGKPAEPNQIAYAVANLISRE